MLSTFNQIKWKVLFTKTTTHKSNDSMRHSNRTASKSNKSPRLRGDGLAFLKERLPKKL